MATAITNPVCRAPIPSNYFCKSCGLSAHHWIMDCSLLAVFHAARKILDPNNNELPDSLVNVCITCGDHSVTECQSLYRIIMALKFYQNNYNSFSNNALLDYFNRYNHLLNDYTHILSTHLNQDKEHNDINATILHTKVNQFIKCQIKTCPFFIRQHHHDNRSHHHHENENENITFYKNTLETIHCYFLHPFHTGFKMVKSQSYTHADCEENINFNEDISWEDTELMQLQSELNIRRDLLRSIRGKEYNQYSKFMIDIPEQNFEVSEKYLSEHDEKAAAERERVPKMNNYFGERYYYWEWYKNNESEDWRCNPGRKYCDLYISAKYENLKHEITANNAFRLNLIDFKIAYFKAIKYLSDSQVIRKMKSFHNELCHYGIADGQGLKIHHLISLILHCDYKHLSHKFVQTFRREQAMVGMVSFESDSKFKLRKREYYFWSRYLRETVELYGTPITESKISIFYVSISNPIIFNAFSARFCLPTSTTSQLEIVTMCTNNNGLILELKSTSETASFYQGLLKYFNCALISAFAEEDERLFIGGWAHLQFNNIRVLIERKENYMIFIRAIQHFNAVLNGEENEENDTRTLDSLYLKINNTSFTSRLSRNDTSYSEYSQYSQSEIKSTRNNIHIEMNNEHKCNKIDGEIVHKLCRKNNGYPLYVNKMFAVILRERENIFINLNELLCNYKPFFSGIFICNEYESLIRFNFLNRLFTNCKVMTVDMYNYQQLNTNYLLAFCDEMSKIDENKNNKLEKIVLLKVKKECITLDIWDKIHRKYSKFKEKLWFKCLCTFRYSSDKDLQIFFDQNAHKLYLKNQETDDVSVSVSHSERQNDDNDFWLIDAPKSHRL